MRKYISLCLLAVGLASNVTAQYVDGTAATKEIQESFANTYEDWDEMRVEIGSNMYIQPDIVILGNTYKNRPTAFGVAVNYLHGFAVSKKKPLFLTTGFGMRYGMYNEKLEPVIYEYTGIAREKFKLFTLEVPVNIGYRFNKPDSDWSAMLYTGIYMRLHLFGKLEEEDGSGYGIGINIFDKNELQPTFERFQCGWQFGCDVQYRKFVFGWKYGIDFNKIWIDTRSFTSTFNVGYRF